MENKVNITTLSAALAKSTGKSKKLCEDFLREFFKLAGESLTSGETLKIKGFGSFKISEVEGRTGVNVNTGEKQEISPYKKVVFTPAKELASVINAPFEDFESTEVDDDFPEDLLVGETVAEIPSDENQVVSGIIEAGSEEEEADDIITEEAYEKIDEDASKQEEVAKSEESENVVEAENPEERNVGLVVPYYEEYEEPTKSRFGVGMLIGSLSTLCVCVVIFMLGCFFDWWPVNFGKAGEKTEEVTPVQISDIVEPAPEEEIPEEEPVYDTVSTTRYLTTIAREHYGNFNLWPYIYLENESILGHPDRITPGTKVVVPSLSKYGVDPENKEDIEKAKQKALEIYARFK